MPGRKNTEEYNEYMRVYILKRYHRRRQEAIDHLGGICMRCGSAGPLEFDHVDRKTKSGSIGKIWSWSEKRFWNEIAKCQLLCQPCHLDKSRDCGDVLPATDHGRLGMYRRGCRCDVCRARNAEYARQYRRTHPRKKKQASLA